MVPRMIAGCWDGNQHQPDRKTWVYYSLDSWCHVDAVESLSSKDDSGAQKKGSWLTDVWVLQHLGCLQLYMDIQNDWKCSISTYTENEFVDTSANSVLQRWMKQKIVFFPVGMGEVRSTSNVEVFF